MLSQRYAVQANDRVWVPNPSLGDAEALKLWEKYLPESTHPLYIPALVRTRDGSTVVVDTIFEPSVTLEVATTDVLPVVGEDVDRGGLDDLSTLVSVHRQAILHALYERFLARQLFVAAGNILVSLRPFLSSSVGGGKNKGGGGDVEGGIEKGPFSRDVMEKYHGWQVTGAKILGRDPHIYALVEALHTQVLDGDSPQCVVFLGESGSGKSELCKASIEYLVTMYSVGGGESIYAPTVTTDRAASTNGGAGAGGSPGRTGVHMLGTYTCPFINWGLPETDKRLLGAQVILDSFTHASVACNHNSTRASKWVELAFDTAGVVRGGSVRVTMLEASRVTFRDPTRPLERNFHVFYELLAAADDAKLDKLCIDRTRLKAELAYAATANASSETAAKAKLPGPEGPRDDALQRRYWEQYASEFIDITQRAWEETEMVLGAVLALGEFAQDVGVGCKPDAAVQHLGTLASLLSMPADAISRALATGIHGSTADTEASSDPADDFIAILGARSPLEVQDVLHSTARMLYARLVELVTSRLDKVLRDDAGSDAGVRGRIAFLDTAGFENLDENGLGALVNNYAFERLMAQFVHTTFTSLTDEYVAEGIGVPAFLQNPRPSKSLLDFYHAPSTGVLSVLADLGDSGPSTKEAHLFFSLVTQNRTNEAFVSSKRSREAGAKVNRRGSMGVPSNMLFTVSHFGSDVSYKVNGFRAASRLHPNVAAFAECMASSSMTSIKLMFLGSGRNATIPGAATAHDEADALLESLGEAPRKTRHVMCLKPCEKLRGNLWEPEHVDRQLKQLSLETCLQLDSYAFPHRIPLDAFYERYRWAIPHVMTADAHPQHSEAVKYRTRGRTESASHFRAKRLVKYLFREVAKHTSSVLDSASSGKVGSKNIFLSKPAFEAFEHIRAGAMELLDNGFGRLQAHVRRRRARALFVVKRNGAMALQAVVRMRRAMQRAGPDGGPLIDACGGNWHS